MTSTQPCSEASPGKHQTETAASIQPSTESSTAEADVKPTDAQGSSGAGSDVLPLSVSNKYVFGEARDFKVREKSFSLAADTTIRDADTNDVLFKVKGKVLSIHSSRKLYDVDETPLYKVQEMMLTFRNRMYIKDLRTNEVILTLRERTGVYVPFLQKRNVFIWKGEDTDDDTDAWMQLEGNLTRECYILKDNEKNCEAAVLSKKLIKEHSKQKINDDRHDYIVRVNPGYDTSLMVFLAVAIEQYFEGDFDFLFDVILSM